MNREAPNLLAAGGSVIPPQTHQSNVAKSGCSELPDNEQSIQLVNQYLAAVQNSSSTGSFLPSTKTLIEQLVSIIQHEPQKNLLSVIQAASKELTSEAVPSRASANRLLADLMAPLVESNILMKNQVHFLVEFFIDKLADGPSIVIEAIKGLKHLSRSAGFQADHVVDCCKALFLNITPRDFDQPKRLTILMLIDNLMAYHRDVLKNMGSDFLTGYCTLAEGEKDPRNLIVAFRLAKVILTEFELGDQVESMFDITFCYFPITFRPPPGNPDAYGGISAEELIQGLIGCLSATPEIGILVLPLLLEKFQAPGFGPKAQVLKTVIQAFPIYGQATVAEFAPLFWECFLVEIFQPNTSSKEFTGLMERASQTLFKTVFPPDADFSPSGPVDFIKQALEVIMKELHSPEKSRAVPATRLLCWIIESGANTTDVILAAITTSIDTLLQLWARVTIAKDDDGLKKQTSILGHLSTIFSSIATVTKEHASEEAFSSGAWLTTTTRHEILTILLTEVTGNEQCVDSPTQLAALWALVRFAGIQDALDLQGAKNVVETVTRLLAVGHNDEMINTAIQCLSFLADSHPTDVASIAIPELFQKLPTLSHPSVTSPAPAKYLHILECLAALCNRTTLIEVFLVRLLDAFAFNCRATSQQYIHALINKDVPVDQFDCNQYSHYLLLCLYATIKSQVEGSRDESKKTTIDFEQSAMMTTQARFVIGRLFEILLCEDNTLDLTSIVEKANEKIAAELGQHVDTSSVRDHCSIRNDVQLVIDVGRIVNLLVRQLDFKQQQELATQLHSGYHSGDMGSFIEGLLTNLPPSWISQTKRAEAYFNPMCIDSSDADKNMMILYSETLIAIRPGIKIPGEALSTTDFFAFKCYHHVCDNASSNLVAFQASLRLLCSTVNRRAEDFPEFFGEQLNEFWESQINADESKSQRSRKLALEIWMWVAKGLIVRSDNRGYELLDRVCILLKEQSDFGRWVAKRLSVLVDAKDETLSPKNFAIIKFLWRQRVCHYLVARLVQGYAESNGDMHSVYLVGLATSLARVGSSLVSLQHQNVIPLLLEATKLHDLDVKLDSLSTIHDFVVNDNSSVTFQKNLSTLVSVLLLNCTFGSSITPTGCERELDTLQSSSPSPGVTSARIRLLALKVLSILPTKTGDGGSIFPDPKAADQTQSVSKGVLYGERSRVLKVLKDVLDDPKRDVRRMAVDCRARWFSFNAN